MPKVMMTKKGIRYVMCKCGRKVSLEVMISNECYCGEYAYDTEGKARNIGNGWSKEVLSLIK